MEISPVTDVTDADVDDGNDFVLKSRFGLHRRLPLFPAWQRRSESSSHTLSSL